MNPKRIMAIVLGLLLLLWYRPALGPTPQVSTTCEGRLCTPSAVNDAKTVVRRLSWVSDYGSEELNEYSRVALKPGESLRFEFDPMSFAGQARVEELIRQVVKDETNSLVLKWESGETLLVSSRWEERGFDFGVLEWEMPWVQYEIVPRHLVVAVSSGGQEVLFNVPVSTVGAIAMTNDFRSARFARPLSLGWLHVGLTEFVMDLHSGAVHMDTTIKHGSFHRENYMLLDWQQKTWEIMRELGLSGRAQGLSNGNSLLAIHGDRLRVYTRTGENVLSYDIKRGVLEFESEWSRFYCVFWSPDDSKLLYNNPRDAHHLDAYILDLQTGEARLLGTDHAILSVSPFSAHLFTRLHTQEGGIWSIMDYSGHSIRLNKTNETALVVKWIDSNRALVNKYTEPLSPLYSNSRCYIYHIAEGRWEFVAAGFGFDYDPLTGTAYLLRATTCP